MRNLIILLLSILFITNAYSQEKHPRVIELENSLTQDVSNYLRSRFPSRPFLVNVSILPLRRQELARAVSPQDDYLPYSDVAAEEKLDEWDNPEVSLTQLMNRVVKVSISLSIPTDVTDDESAELKEALIHSLHLIPARDEIVIQRRSWQQPGSNNLQTWILLSGLLLLMAILLIGGSYITKSAAQKVSQAIQSSANSATAPAQANSSMTSLPKNDSNNRQGDLKVSDPIRVRELIRQYATELSTKIQFPNLEQINLLEEVGGKNPLVVSALVAELPAKIKQKIFSYGSSQWWLEAFLSVGQYDIDVLALCEELVRLDTNAHSANLEECLLLTWRLPAKERNALVKNLGAETGLKLLKYLPQSLSISTAKTIFPGAWGTLLESQEVLPQMNDLELAKIKEQALNLSPLRSWGVLEKYKQERSLLKFLSQASIPDEKDIYGSLTDDSTIPKIRPPFYLVLECERSDYKEFIQSIMISMWALALFNIPQGLQKNVTQHLNEKQMMAMKDLLRRLDTQAKKDETQFYQGREFIAKKFSEWLENKQEVIVEEVSENKESEAA